MLDTIHYHFPCCPPPKKPGRGVFHFGVSRDVTEPPTPVGNSTRRIHEEPDVEKDLLTEQLVTVTVVAFKDDRGHVVGVDGPPQWATDNSDVLTLTPAADGMSCVVTAGIMAGDATVQMTADPDLSSNVKQLVGTVLFHVKAREATTVELAVGDASDLPPT